MPPRRIGPLSILLLLLLPPGAAAQEAAAALGKQRAAEGAIEWQVREAGHPVLGNIRFAYISRPVETRAGEATVYSRAYVSCQKGKRSFAIELANAMAPADPSGLMPAVEPRLICHRPEDGRIVTEEILATWEVNPKIGDALARGLRGFPLRECAAITVQQEVVLPEGSARKTARLDFDILPYDRVLDSIFAACGERSAYGPAAPPASASAAPVAAARASPAAPSKAAPKPAPAAGGGWREARTVHSGRSNVRAGPTLQSAIVIALHPGSVVLVQRAGGDWWRIRPARGRAFEGYIRDDRLVIK